MRRRLLIIVSIAVLLAGVGVVALWWMRPQLRIDQDALAQIRGGMTEQEVSAIIGAPPGNYGVGEGVPMVWEAPLWLHTPPTQLKHWVGQEKSINVYFNLDGKVINRNLTGVWREYDSHFDRLCGLLHLKAPKPQPIIFVN